MKKETRTICHDEELHLEAYSFEGISQPFPNHFHDYYVIGCVENGTRRMSCKNKIYTINAGNILLFNPGDNHGCVQSEGGSFDYRGLNIPKQAMAELTEEITGNGGLPYFSENVIENGELKNYICSLHKMITENRGKFEKEETLLLMISLLTERYGQPFLQVISKRGEEVERACEFMDRHFSEHISLEQLCEISGFSKSTLLRSFTKFKGITPYRYLQTIRINKAKQLLEQGAAPIDAALQTGFSDQSHFTNFFNMFIGLSPASYGKIFTDTGS